MMNHIHSDFSGENVNGFGSENFPESSGGVFDAMTEDGTSGAAPTVENAKDAKETKDAKNAEDTKDTKDVEDAEEAEEAEDTKDTKNAKDAKDAKNAKDAKKKGGFGKVVLLLLLALLAAAAVRVLLYFHNRAVFGDLFGKHTVYATNVTTLNLSGSDYNDYSQIAKLKEMETVVLTNSSFNDLAALYPCKKLRNVILADRVLSAEECIDFYSHLPQAALQCRVLIGEDIYDSELTTLAVENADEDTQRLYAALGRLEQLDLTACEVSDETLAFLCDALPQCTVLARVSIGGKEYTTDAEAVALGENATQRDAEILRCFRNLKVIDITQCGDSELTGKITTMYPDVSLNEPVELLGRTFGTADELIDLRGKKYTLAQVKAALEEALPKLKKLKKIDMCGCGLSNAEMEQLCEAYPKIKFVWMIHFVHWDVRTDAVVFSSLNSIGSSVYTQRDYAPLFKYCTDLVSLDLGHSRITDISAIANLKKLRAVILVDNKIRDISAFAELKDLEFIEMNATNRVQSIEPLKDLKNLKYINMWGSMDITDLSPLYNHENLKLTIFERTISLEEQKRFKESNPGCEAYFKVDSAHITTNNAWRSNPYRKKIKNANIRKDLGIFMHWMYIVGFDEETGEFIVDYNTDQYKYM